jgi:hypothetical protein
MHLGKRMLDFLMSATSWVLLRSDTAKLALVA